MTTETQLLRDAGIFPDDKVLENALGKEVFPVYQELMTMVKNEFGLLPEWRFYKDGNAWLCKNVGGKKTIFWLSVWQRYIKTSFYFTEKTRGGILELDIDPGIKEAFNHTKTIGRLIPLILDISRTEQLDDFRKIAGYKIKQK